MEGEEEVRENRIVSQLGKKLFRESTRLDIAVLGLVWLKLYVPV